MPRAALPRTTHVEMSKLGNRCQETKDIRNTRYKGNKYYKSSGGLSETTLQS